MGRNRRKKKSQGDEDSNAKDREKVQILKENFNRSEREIYLALRECNMNVNIAYDRLLSEGEDKEKEFVQNLKKLVNCSEEKIQEVLRECSMDANEAVNRLLTQDNIPEDKREIVQKLKNIVNCSKQEIYAVLLECNMDADKAVNSLLSQDNPPADMKEIVDNMKEVVNFSEKEIQAKLDKAVNHLRSQDDHQLGSGNKFGSDGKETSNVQGDQLDVPNQSSNSSIDSAAKRDQLQESVSVSKQIVCSDDNGDSRLLCNKNDETQQHIQSLAKAVSSLSVSPSLRYADVVKMGLASSKETVEQRLQRQSINTFVDAMRQQAETQYSASPLNQSMPSLSSLTEMNEQAISHHYSQPEVPFTVGPYGSAHGSTDGSAHGSTDGSAHSSTYPSSSGSSYGSTNGSTYSSAHCSAYGSPSGAAYGSSMWSDNAADLRHESDDDFANNVASLFRKSKNSNVWDPQGHNNSGNNSYRFFTSHDQIHQSPSFIPIQPQQQQQHQIHQSPSFIPIQPQQQRQWNHQSPSFILIQPQQQQHWNHQSLSFIPIQPQQQQHWNHQSPSFTHIQPQQHQQQQHQNNRRDPSKQTQKEPGPRNNYE